MMEDPPPLQSPDAGLGSRPARARYQKARDVLELKWRRRELDCDRMMREIVDVLWDHFAEKPYSWCGFYRLSRDGDSLILGPHREKPACSPLPMHGVCGRAARTGQPLVVGDVKSLGTDRHVECDPANLSEVALPVFDRSGKVWAVFDVDSASKDAFDEMHVRWLERILKAFQRIECAD